MAGRHREVLPRPAPRPTARSSHTCSGRVPTAASQKHQDSPRLLLLVLVLALCCVPACTTERTPHPPGGHCPRWAGKPGQGRQGSPVGPLFPPDRLPADPVGKRDEISGELRGNKETPGPRMSLPALSAPLSGSSSGGADLTISW